MKALTAAEICGNWATLLCAWADDDALDIGRVVAEIDTLVSFGVDGIYSNGTAGEFHLQTEEDFDSISRHLAAACEKADVPFQIGVSHTNPHVSLDRLRRVRDLRPSAVQIIIPDWFPVTDDEAYAFLARAAEVAEGVGLVLYNPPHAKRVLTPEEVGRLAERVPTLVGLKTAAGDDAWYERMRRSIPSLSVFVPGHTLASGVQRGARGAYSNVACLHPLGAQRWTDRMKNDMEGALEVEGRIRRFMSEYIAPFITELGYSNPAADRFMAVVGGWANVGSRMRFPYRNIPDGEVERVRRAARELIPEIVPPT